MKRIALRSVNSLRFLRVAIILVVLVGFPCLTTGFCAPASVGFDSESLAPTSISRRTDGQKDWNKASQALQSLSGVALDQGKEHLIQFMRGTRVVLTTNEYKFLTNLLHKLKNLRRTGGFLREILVKNRQEQRSMGFSIKSRSLNHDPLLLEMGHPVAFLDLRIQGVNGRVYFFEEPKLFLDAWQKGEIAEPILSAMGMRAAPSQEDRHSMLNSPLAGLWLTFETKEENLQKVQASTQDLLDEARLLEREGDLPRALRSYRAALVSYRLNRVERTVRSLRALIASWNLPREMRRVEQRILELEAKIQTGHGPLVTSREPPGNAPLGRATLQTFYGVRDQTNWEQLLEWTCNHVPVFFVDQDSTAQGGYHVDRNGAFFEPTVPYDVVKRYQKILQSIIDSNPKMGEFLSDPENAADYLDYFSLSDFQTLLSHRLHEEGKFETEEVFIRNYVTAAMRKELDATEEALPHSKKYRKYILGFLRDYRPTGFGARKQLLITGSLPEKVVLRPKASAQDWKNQNVMIMDEQGYAFSSKRPVPEEPGKFYPGEKIVLARWKDELFLLYTSRSHTLRGVLVHQWRNGNLVLENHMLKSNPENLDDIPGKLNVMLDQAIYSKEMEFSLADQGFFNRLDEVNMALTGSGNYDRLRLRVTRGTKNPSSRHLQTNDPTSLAL